MTRTHIARIVGHTKAAFSRISTQISRKSPCFPITAIPCMISGHRPINCTAADILLRFPAAMLSALHGGSKLLGGGTAGPSVEGEAGTKGGAKAKSSKGASAQKQGTSRPGATGSVGSARSEGSEQRAVLLTTAHCRSSRIEAVPWLLEALGRRAMIISRQMMSDDYLPPARFFYASRSELVLTDHATPHLTPSAPHIPETTLSTYQRPTPQLSEYK